MRYEGKSIMNNLNCEMEVHARVCKENKLEIEFELEENTTPIDKICGKRCEFEGSYRKSGGCITMIFSRMITL